MELEEYPASLDYPEFYPLQAQLLVVLVELALSFLCCNWRAEHDAGGFARQLCVRDFLRLLLHVLRRKVGHASPSMQISVGKGWHQGPTREVQRAMLHAQKAARVTLHLKFHS